MSFSAAGRRDRREQPRARAAVPFETAAHSSALPPSGSVELREEDLPDGPAPTSLMIGDSIIEAAIASRPRTNPEVGC
jgi:hypothetical protein